MYTTKKSLFPLSLLMMSVVAGMDNCRSEGNGRILSSYSENFEEGNLIGPKKPHRPKQDWDKKPQVHTGNINSMDYFKKFPDNLDKASKSLSNTNKSFIIQKDINGENDFNDLRF